MSERGKETFGLEWPCFQEFVLLRKMADLLVKKISLAENADEIKTKLESLQREQEKKSPTIYFGYGSNLWKEQMSLRCPSSIFMGVGRLPGYRWMINDRGFANVVLSSRPGAEVYGLIYSLTHDDERSLDRNEGVPFAYTKEVLPVDFWPSRGGTCTLDVADKPEQREMLVYIDRKRTEDDRPKEEYIYRINMGIKDGVLEGIPQGYMDRQLRQFIPAEGREEVEELAKRQALCFEDAR